MRHIILTEHERELHRLIEHVTTELRVTALVDEATGKPQYNNSRILDLLNLKGMLLGSLLARVERTQK